MDDEDIESEIYIKKEKQLSVKQYGKKRKNKDNKQEINENYNTWVAFMTRQSIF